MERSGASKSNVDYRSLLRLDKNDGLYIELGRYRVVGNGQSKVVVLMILA